MKSLQKVYIRNGEVVYKFVSHNNPSSWVLHETVSDLAVDYMSQSGLVRRAGSFTRDPGMSEKMTKNQVCEYMSSLAFVVFSCLHKGFTRQTSLHFLLLFSVFTRTILNI